VEWVFELWSDAALGRALTFPSQNAVNLSGHFYAKMSKDKEATQKLTQVFVSSCFDKRRFAIR
jgi:hypothetical protein